MDTCPICGREVPDGTEECPECGAPLAPNRTEPTVDTVAPVGKQALSGSPAKLFLGIGMAISLVNVMVSIVGGVMLAVSRGSVLWAVAGFLGAAFWTGQCCVFKKVHELYGFHPAAPEART